MLTLCCSCEVSIVAIVQQLLEVMQMSVRFRPFAPCRSEVDPIWQYNHQRRSVRLGGSKTVTHGDRSKLPAYM